LLSKYLRLRRDWQGADPESGLPVYVRTGRFGAYVQLGEAGGKEKPRTGSLLKSMTPASMTLPRTSSACMRLYLRPVLYKSTPNQ